MTARRWVLVVLAFALIGGGVVYALTKTDSEDIYLEGAGDTGANPFTTIAVSQCVDYYEIVPGSTDCVRVDETTTSSTIGSGTTTTALYGGSGNQKVCDPEALITYLTTHPDKAKAWVDGQNEDATLEWSGGHTITVDDIPKFIRELTPTFLTEDTRVTNHGYVKGKATPHQSVLQKGTAVLVDRNGIPRARCACGNPLGRPHKVRDPHYKGHCWKGCHDRPYCAPPGCSGTTTSSEPTTSTSTSTTAPSTTTSRPPGQKQPTTTTHAPTTTTRPPTTTTTMPTTTSTFRDPNCPPPGPADCKP